MSAGPERTNRTPDFLRESIDNEKMFIATENEKISAAMVLNHSGNESYREYNWPTAADDSEVMVIHALGVDPEKAGKPDSTSAR